MFHSRPVHSLILSSHHFLCLLLHLPPCTVPCSTVLASQENRVTCHYHLSLRFGFLLPKSGLHTAQWHFQVWFSLPCWLCNLCTRYQGVCGSISPPLPVSFQCLLLRSMFDMYMDTTREHISLVLELIAMQMHTHTSICLPSNVLQPFVLKLFAVTATLPPLSNTHKHTHTQRHTRLLILFAGTATLPPLSNTHTHKDTHACSLSHLLLFQPFLQQLLASLLQYRSTQLQGLILVELAFVQQDAKVLQEGRRSCCGWNLLETLDGLRCAQDSLEQAEMLVRWNFNIRISLFSGFQKAEICQRNLPVKLVHKKIYLSDRCPFQRGQK